jgi:cell division protein FtsW
MDRLLFLAQVSLGVLGVLGVATSSPSTWPEHLVRVAIALTLTVAVSRLSPQRVVKLSPFFYVGVLALLALVLVIGISPEGSDSRRWLLIGNFTLQPSELMKVAVIAYLTAFFHNHLGNWQIWRPMLVMGLAVGLIIAEPNVSTAIFIFLLGLSVMVAAGTTIVRLISIGAAASLIAVLIAGPYLRQFPYISARITGFRDLWGPRADTLGDTYQADRAQRIISEAGLLGLGSGQPVSIPAASTDMIAVSLAHALGLIGVLTLVALYLFIVLRGLSIASSSKGPGALLAAGASTYVGGQAALNLLVAAGLLPVTGVPLPFVSDGFNSLLSVGMAMGLIHSAYRETHSPLPAAKGPALSG